MADKTRIKRAISGKALMKKRYKPVKTGPYTQLIGGIDGNCTITAYGPSGMGKSVFILKLANHLAGAFGKVLYNSHEEALNKSLQDRVRNFVPNLHHKVYFADSWPFETMLQKIKVNKYRVLVIDSVQYMRFTAEQLKTLRETYKKRQIIVIMVSFGTALGKTRGADDLLHDSDVKLYFSKGKVYSQSRYMGNALVTQKLFEATEIPAMDGQPAGEPEPDLFNAQPVTNESN